MSAQILSFTPRTKPAAQRDAETPPAVIIFPGVRYERLDAERSAEPAQPRH